MLGTTHMDLFWSELKFFYKRRVKAWSLFYGIPLTAYFAYDLFCFLRTSISSIHTAGSSHNLSEGFYSFLGLWLFLLLPCFSLTVSKIISMLGPNEVDTGISIPEQTGPNDTSVWPPRPKPLK